MLHFLLHQFHNEVKKLSINWTWKVCCINFAPDFVPSKRSNMKYVFNSTYHNNLLYIQDSFFTATVPK